MKIPYFSFNFLKRCGLSKTAQFVRTSLEIFAKHSKKNAFLLDFRKFRRLPGEMALENSESFAACSEKAGSFGEFFSSAAVSPENLLFFLESFLQGRRFAQQRLVSV